MNLKKVRKKTEYNAEKKNKMNNFEFLNTHYCIKGQVVLAGDSITELYNHTELFSKFTKRTGLCVYNRGISGDTSDRLLERFEKNVLNLEPSNIVLLIGTNDFGYGADADFAAENIEKILALSQKLCPKANIILETVYPINDKIRKQGGRNNDNISLLNSKIKVLAVRYGVTLVDMTAKLSDRDGRLKEKYTYDGLHINALAYEEITGEIAPLLRKI